MARTLLAALLIFSSSCALPPAERRVDFVLENQSEEPLEIEVRSGIFSRTISVAPGSRWKGWADPRLAGGEISVRFRRAPK